MNAVASFIFDKGQKAFAAVLSWNLIASLLFLTTNIVLLALQRNSERKTINLIGYLLTPTYALGITMHLQMNMYCILDRGSGSTQKIF
jgi:hypothetical protein